MEPLSPLVLPLVAFVAAFGAAWAIATWRTQVRTGQLQTDLQLIQAELARSQGQVDDQQARLEALTEVKNGLDVACGRLETERDNGKAQLGQLEQELTSLRERLEALRRSEQQAREDGARDRETAARLQEQLESVAVAWKERILERDQRLEVSKDELKSTQEKYNALTNAHSRLKSSLEEKQQHFDQQLKLLQESREGLTKEFERLANEVLERKGRAFKELNQESIGNLLKPIQTEMMGFRAKVEAIHTKDAEQRIELRTELKNLQLLNREITDQADKLTTALQGQKKVQGNWGELMLENVLDNAGLRLGIDYKREVSFTTEEGRQRPDAIVYLPHKQHLVIDAKTSLVAYTQYVNADNELERGQALAAHARAVSDRVNELADRDYFKLPGLNSPEVVIMFVPIESAYVEALKYDDTLFQRAIERNVLVATPTTLLTSLNIVRQLWRFEDQNKHTAELASRAEKFYAKLNGFLTSMKGVGTQLDRAREGYDKAFGQLYTGKGNLIKQAAEFKDLGVSVQKELPADLVERANLELGEEPALGGGVAVVPGGGGR